MIEQPDLDFEARSRQAERLQNVALLHWSAFSAQWKEDGKPSVHKQMHAAFKKQQAELLAGKIRVLVTFANAETKPIGIFARQDGPDPLLANIYVTGLTIKPL